MDAAVRASMRLFGDTADTLAEAAETGERALLSLSSQNEALGSAGAKARSLTDVASATRHEISTLDRRRFWRRGALWSVLVVQLAVIAALVYRMATNGGSLRDVGR